MSRPKIRDLESFVVQEKGKSYLVLRDNEGFTDKAAFLSPAEALIASRFDGKTDPEQISADLQREFGGAAIPVKMIWKLIETLNKNLMLETESFLRQKRHFLEAYRQIPERPCLLAGRSYADDPNILNKDLAAFFRLPGAPGKIPARNGDAPLTGLVAPHIDYPRGGIGYAWSYGEILKSGLADLYVIFGVAHASPPTPLVLTDKDFATPFGTVPVDKELSAAFAEQVSFDIREHEIAHRSEHSIELQTVFLKWAETRLKKPFKILPILASTFDLDEQGRNADADAALDSLAGLLKSYQGTVCLLAGVDLAHIGPRFGDPEPVTEEWLERTRAQDAASLDKASALDADGFLESILFDGNKRKVCGLTALYSFLRVQKALRPDAKGSLLHYAHAADPAGGEVTFASMAFR